MLGDDVIPKCAELATQPCTEADNCDIVQDCEDRRLKGVIPRDIKMTEVGMLGDDRIVRWDGPDTQPCTGAEDCRMIGDGGDDANEDESYVVEYTEMNGERWVIGRDSLH